MPNLALYRKYRPEIFSEVSGQETITRILKNQIAMDRIGHAYLFTGIRGTGKTTIAKIFARAVNCENPVDGSPCGECETCKALESTNNMDITEIDAASNRGVDEIRNLRETVTYPPTNGTYKVYIVDEVHMLTKEAFNALLKTLEEPPNHAIFILATTEPAKLPATILSRCQIFNVKPIAYDVIVDRLEEIIKRENVDIERSALEEIAHRSGHSMRDALSLLDQCIDLRLPGETITLEDVSDFLGISSTEQIERIIKAIAGYDSVELTKVLADIRRTGREDDILLEDLSEALKEILYFKLTSVAESGREEFLNRTAPLFSTERLYEIIDKLVSVHAKLKYNRLSQILTDTALLSLTRDSENEVEPVLKPTPQVEKKVTVENTIPVFEDYNEVPVYEPPVEMDSAPPIEMKEVPDREVVSTSEPVVEEKTIKTESREEKLKSPKEKKEEVSEQEETSPKMTTKLFKKRITELANQNGEKLLTDLITVSEFIINKNGLFIIIEDDYRFLLDIGNFKEHLQKLVDLAMGEHTKIYPRLKSQYQEFLKKKNKSEPSFEDQVREVVGEDVPYEKE